MENENSIEAAIELVKKAESIGKELKELKEKEKELNRELLSILGGYGIDGKLVEIMEDLELEDFTVNDIGKIEVNEELQIPSMAATSKYRDTIIKWLKKSNNDGIIKGSVTVPFSPGDERVKEVISAIKNIGMNFDEYETVHPQTLKSFIRDTMEKGEIDVPLDEIGIKEFKTVKIKNTKSFKNKATGVL